MEGKHFDFCGEIKNLHDKNLFCGVMLFQMIFNEDKEYFKLG